MRSSRFAVLTLLVFVISLCGCDAAATKTAAGITGGNPYRGASSISKYGCGSCHTIPGINGAHGMVGPSLAGIARRVYVAGVLPNQPLNLMRWIQNPKAVDEKTAMPNLGVTARDATDIAAYLYSLK